MPGPQTQHKGVVYGDDEINAPKPNRLPELGPPVRRRPQHTQTGGPRAATPQGLTALRTPDRQTGATVCVWGSLFMLAHSLESLVLQVVVARQNMRDLGHGSYRICQRPAGQREGHAWRPFAARAAGRHRRPQHRCRPPVAEHVVPPAPVLIYLLTY